MEFIWDGFQEAIRLLIEGDPRVVDAALRSLWISVAAVSIGGAFGISIGSVLARKKFWGSSLLVIIFRGAMSIPTVMIGLIGYAVLSRRGPLGEFDLLYTQWAIVLGEFFLALPIITSWTHTSIRGLDSRVAETALTLGASSVRRWWTYLSEARLGLALALLTAFSRCFTELGIAMMVGGNILYRTRTLTTSTALETARGEFDRGIAMSLVLLMMAMVITLVIAILGREEREV